MTNFALVATVLLALTSATALKNEKSSLVPTDSAVATPKDAPTNLAVSASGKAILQKKKASGDAHDSEASSAAPGEKQLHRGDGDGSTEFSPTHHEAHQSYRLASKTNDVTDGIKYKVETIKRSDAYTFAGNDKDEDEMEAHKSDVATKTAEWEDTSKVSNELVGDFQKAADSWSEAHRLQRTGGSKEAKQQVLAKVLVALRKGYGYYDAAREVGASEQALGQAKEQGNDQQVKMIGASLAQAKSKTEHAKRSAEMAFKKLTYALQ